MIFTLTYKPSSPPKLSAENYIKWTKNPGYNFPQPQSQVPASPVMFLLYYYCNGFDQRIARQQLCKQGPTRNNRLAG
jgi:hypothetical protein